MTYEEKINWCIEQHTKTNHWYDTYLPYEFHLRMVSQAAIDFIHLIPDSNDGESMYRDCVLLGAWGHDLIEDTRTSYNDVKEQLGQRAADIVYAVSNNKGKNRSERANDDYYTGIRLTQGAIFVKLCDRIANVQYSKMTKSRMFAMYKKENDNFMKKLGYDPASDLIQYNEMFIYLINLFND